MVAASSGSMQRTILQRFGRIRYSTELARRNTCLSSSAAFSSFSENHHPPCHLPTTHQQVHDNSTSHHNHVYNQSHCNVRTPLLWRSYHQQQQQPTIRTSNSWNRWFSTGRNQPSSSIRDDDDQEPAAAKAEPIPSCVLPYTGLPSHPDTIELEPGQRLVAIGDVHGDFPHLLEALKLAGVVAEVVPEESYIEDTGGGRTFGWVGGNTIVVQIGDVLDRGHYELPCWQLLADLSRQAAAQKGGGRVIQLYGNHELWTSIGFYQLDQERYMENLDYDDGIDDYFEMSFGHHLEIALEECEEDWRASRLLNHLITSGVELHPRKVAARWAAMEPGGLLAKHFLATFKIAVQVGETVLVHAGMVPEHLDRFGGIDGMNKTTRNWILKEEQAHAGRRAMFVPPNDPEGRLRTYVQSMPDFFMEGDDNAHSPIWMRDYSDPPDDIPSNQEAGDMLGTP